MSNRVILRSACALLAAGISLLGNAFDAGHFAQSSRLSQGHWVKVSISQSGVYEIGRDQLAEMGFSDPNRVKVYGYGGKVLGDLLSSSLPDDLAQVPALRTDDKLCFYGIGDVSMNLTTSGSMPVFTRERNTYSLRSHYFLTDSGDDPVLSLERRAHQSENEFEANDKMLSTSYDCLLHEQELRSLSFTGSELLGEDITQGRRAIPYRLVNASSDSVYLTTRLASKIVRILATDVSSIIQGQFHCYLTAGGETVEAPYDATSGRVKGCTRDYTFYESAESTVRTLVPGNEGTLRYMVEETTGKGVMQVSVLDYFIMTYRHHNTLDGQPDGQCLMGYPATSGEKVAVVGPRSTVVWDITDKVCPVMMETKEADGDMLTFTPGVRTTARQYLAFDPQAELLHIDAFQPVENQNLHGLSVPDMLIITNSTFMPQAERVAQLHRQHDGMEVHVVDQEQVFNEFSSGTPSAMAYRLLCKMFYDRDASRFKNLLLFGHCSFDNRGIVTGKKDRLMCYETAVSNYDDNSHAVEDYFGYLRDNSGTVLSSDSLMIGIGRIPCSSLTEAKSDVDKLYEYVLSPDYGPWRNNYFVWAEQSTEKENILHERQADGIAYILENDLNVRMMPDKCFIGMFPRELSESFKEEDKRMSSEAKRHVKEMLTEGQYFGTYVGHAGATTFTHSSLWRIDDVTENNYAHFPIMTTACCDVARFDSDHHGIAEQMFHQRNGGAIALFTTARQVYANSNDKLNRAFTTAMFSYDKNKQMPTLGEAYRQAKLCYGRVSNSNKLNFLLLGDPALRVNYPKPVFKITKVGTTAITGSQDVTVRPLQRVQIEAKVMNENDSTAVNTAFNGEATVTLYDIKREFMSVPGTGDHEGETHTCYYPQEMLARVTGRVTNGVFSGSIVIPRYERSKGGRCTLSVYAHQDNTDQMVNGIYNNLIVSTYNGTNTVSDDQAPVIESMFLNDEESFAASAHVGNTATLHVRATDNTAFNLQQQALGQGMTLKLDQGKTSYTLVKNHATVSDEGRTLEIAMPLTNLTAGRHTLDFAVSDVCGNRTTHSIAFIVSDSNDLTLSTSERSSCERAEIDLLPNTLSQTPTINLKVTNLKGELVWSQPVSQFPFTWDLTDNDGRRVRPGLYKIHGNYELAEAYGGTNMVSFVVLNPLEQ